MPWTPCAIKVEPNGNTASVTIRRNNSSGRIVEAYTTENGSSLHSFPDSINTATVYYLEQPGQYYVTAEVEDIVDSQTHYVERFQTATHMVIGASEASEVARTVLTSYATKASPSFTGDVSIASGGTIAMFNAFPSQTRQPWVANPRIDLAAAANDGLSNNLVGFTLGASIHGDADGLSGTDTGFWWGMNLFAVVDDDVRNMDTAVGFLGELALQQDGGTIDTVMGMQSDITLYGAAADAAVTTMISMRVSHPRRKSGATGGSVTNAYGLYVEGPPQSNMDDIGTSSLFSLFVEGGKSRFQGEVQVTGVIRNTTSSNATLEIFSDSGGRASGSSLMLRDNDGNGSAEVFLSKAASGFAVLNNTGSVVMHKHYIEGHWLARTATATPATPPAGCIFMYWDGSDLKVKKSDSSVHTVTLVADA